MPGKPWPHLFEKICTYRQVYRHLFYCSEVEQITVSLSGSRTDGSANALGQYKQVPDCEPDYENGLAQKKACSKPMHPQMGFMVQSRPGCSCSKNCAEELALGNNLAQLGVQGITPYAKRLGGLQHVAAIVL